jgi:hypothetical protein
MAIPKSAAFFAAIARVFAPCTATVWTLTAFGVPTPSMTPRTLALSRVIATKLQHETPVRLHFTTSDYQRRTH